MSPRGIEVSEIFHLGPNGPVGGPDPEHGTYRSLATFSDPDGNSWLLQEITTRLPGRIDSGVTSFGSASDLASAMRRAEAAHGEHEKRTGGSATLTGPIGTPSTWRRSRPELNCLLESALSDQSLKGKYFGPTLRRHHHWHRSGRPASG